MTATDMKNIAFNVETSRILQILSSEIYDSPKAFLRENVQNAYDAILMRCVQQSLPLAERTIKIEVMKGSLSVNDDGIGMSEEVLRNNFWKAGSSGKKGELAQRSGVIGTFGIGAMANFGVCTSLRVESRHVDSDTVLASYARRDDLSIGQDCIELVRLAESRQPGTIINAELDPEFSITEDEASDYLGQYVRFLPVQVLVNGRLISQQTFIENIDGQSQGFRHISTREVSRNGISGTLQVSLNIRNRVLARLTGISLNGATINGEAFFVQQSGPTHGFRNHFGLAPIPVAGHYGLGGFVNLDILQPTAGREALSRDSIQHVANLVNVIEEEVSVDIAQTEAADVNQQFQQYILAHNRIQLANRVKISVLPADEMIELGDIRDYETQKLKRFYQGRDGDTLREFANDQTNLLHVSQANPRRKLQIRFLTEIMKLEPVPDHAKATRIQSSELIFEEVVFLVALRGVLLEDYLMPNIDAAFATITHSVSFQAQKKGDDIQVFIARNIPSVAMVLECYRTARDVFDGFMKDFVRQHLYPHLREHVPSSKKQGRDALYMRLKQNKELYRLKKSDYAPLESVLTEYLSGKVDLTDLLRVSRAYRPTQQQHVGREHVGRVEDELSDLISSPNKESPANVFDAMPPMVRADVDTDMKVLTVNGEHGAVNHFQMFLALSDSLIKREGEFLHWPHTTRVMWGGPLITYIFTDEAGQLSLYYDIELRQALPGTETGGALFPTTTILTRKRIFVPVPRNLESAFRITSEDKEFYVRFDTIP